MADNLERLTDGQACPTDLIINENRKGARGGGRGKDEGLTNTDLLAGDDHAVDLGDGRVGRHARLVVHVAVALAFSGVIGCDFARQDVSEQRKRVVQRLRSQRTTTPPTTTTRSTDFRTSEELQPCTSYLGTKRLGNTSKYK